MRKIITIGESVLDTLYNGRQPVKAFVGGRIACAAATLGTLQHTVSMVSECATDRVGDLIVDFLERLSPETVVERMAGEVGDEYLVAPSWTAIKHAGRNAVDKALRARDSYQGKYYDPERRDPYA